MTDAPAPPADAPKGLRRNTSNYGDRDFALYLRRSFAKSMGYSQAMLDKPVVGIADTGSDFNNCHRTAPELVEAVKRGVLAAGGLPLAFPTVSLCEPSLSPCSMHYRNLMALDTEAMLAAQPMDAAVLVGGCDKTVPAQLMAAISAGRARRHARHRPDAGAVLRGRAALGLHRLPAATGRATGAGEVTRESIDEIEGKLATTAGTCGVMGTASTMACLAATLGFMPLAAASAPAVHADRLRIAEGSRRPGGAADQPGRCPRGAGHAGERRERDARAARRSAARPMPWSTSPPSPAAPGLRSISRGSTRCPRRRRCWSISSPPATATWRISTPPAACAPCCGSCGTCCTSTRRIWMA
jgi:hypothetical protein